MNGWTRERTLVAGLVAVHLVAMIAVLGLVLGWWSSGSDEEAALSPIGEGDGPGIDGPTISPDDGGLFLITATPGGSPAATSTPSLQRPQPTPTTPPTQPPPPPTQPPPPTNTPPPPPPAPTNPPAAPASTPADFSGRWRIVDVVTQGDNVGQAYSFEVNLTQQGNQISGGNGGIQISGSVQGDTAVLNYVQPALGYTGTFVWTMTSPDSAAGTFTNSYPNSGTSSLQRL